MNNGAVVLEDVDLLDTLDVGQCHLLQYTTQLLVICKHDKTILSEASNMQVRCDRLPPLPLAAPLFFLLTVPAPPVLAPLALPPNLLAIIALRASSISVILVQQLARSLQIACNRTG